MREFVIQRYNKYNQLLQEIGLRTERDKITVNELRNIVISKYPNSIAYKIISVDHISILHSLYFSYLIISGEV